MQQEEQSNSLARKIYSYYRDKYMMTTKKCHARAITNWDSVEAKETYIYFKRFATMVQKSGGQINYQLYIDSLFDHFKGGFNVKNIGTQSSLGIYKRYINNINKLSDATEVYTNVVKSLKFIINYCVDNNINDFNEYFILNYNTFPTVVLHYNSGSISQGCFALIPNIVNRVNSFPTDVINDYFTEEVKKQLITNKMLIVAMNTKLQYIADNFVKIVNDGIQKKKSN